MRSATIDNNGLTIHYQVAGSGEPVILVHGWGSDAHHNWIATGWVQMLQQHRTVIALDVRGHGRSDKPVASDSYGYAQMCSDITAVLDALEVRRVDYVGYSMGAFMGAALLGRCPDRISRMVLGGIGDETPVSAAQGEQVAQALRGECDDGYARSVRQFVEALPHNDLAALACAAQQMWPQGYPSKLAGETGCNAAVPVLVVNGADDDPYVETGKAFADRLAEGRYVEIPHTDHLSVVADERFKQLVMTFLD